MTGHHDMPRVDDHLVDPEVTRDEIVRGQRIYAAPAEAPHADLHFQLNYVIAGLRANGYVGACHLLTRFGRAANKVSKRAASKVSKRLSPLPAGYSVCTSA